MVVLPKEGELPQLLNEIQIETLFMDRFFLQCGQIFVVLLSVVMLWWQLKKQRLKADLIFINSKYGMYPPVYFGRIFKLPMFMQWADYESGLGDIQLIKHVGANRMCLLAVSKSIQAYLKEKGIQDKNIKLLYFGTEEPPKQVSNTESIRKKYSIKPEEIIFGITGRLDIWKGHRYALQAMAKLKEYPIRLIILGRYNMTADRDAFQNELDKIIQESALQDKVIFTGHIPDPAAIVSQMDVVLAPSDFEPFGLVAIEAMALKKPMIASKTGGLEESVIDNETGFLVPPKNAEVLAQKMLFFIQNRPAMNAFGEAGYQRYQKLFTMEGYIKNLIQMFQERSKK